MKLIGILATLTLLSWILFIVTLAKVFVFATLILLLATVIIPVLITLYDMHKDLKQ